MARGIFSVAHNFAGVAGAENSSEGRVFAGGVEIGYTKFRYLSVKRNSSKGHEHRDMKGAYQLSRITAPAFFFFEYADLFSLFSSSVGNLGYS
jgi:hypothetical protein